MEEGKEAWPGMYKIPPKNEPGETTGIVDDALKVEKLADDKAGGGEGEKGDREKVEAHLQNRAMSDER